MSVRATVYRANVVTEVPSVALEVAVGLYGQVHDEGKGRFRIRCPVCGRLQFLDFANVVRNPDQTLSSGEILCFWAAFDSTCSAHFKIVGNAIAPI